MKIINIVSLSGLALFPIIEGCGNNPNANPTQVAQAQAALAQAAQDIAAFTAIPPGDTIPQTLKDALIADLTDVLTADAGLKAINSGDVTTAAFMDVEQQMVEVSNATMQLEEVIVNVVGPSALENVALVTIDPTYPQFLLAAERFNNQILGEIVRDKTSIPPASAAQINLFELNEAVAIDLGEQTRAQMLAIQEQTLDDFLNASLIDVAGTPTLVPSTLGTATLVPPAGVVALPETVAGVFELAAIQLKQAKENLEASTITGAGCGDREDIDPAAANCPAPVAVAPPVPPVSLVTSPVDAPADIAAAANAVLTRFNTLFANYIATAPGVQFAASLVPEVKTIRLELAQLIADFNSLPASVQGDELVLSLQVAQERNETMCAGLMETGIYDCRPPLPPITDADNANNTDLTSITTVIPPAPPPPPAPPAVGHFADTTAAPVTQADALLAGIERARKNMAVFAGENVIAGNTSGGAALPAAQTAALYENAAVKADNNNEPGRAADLRIIATSAATTDFGATVVPFAMTQDFQDALREIRQAVEPDDEGDDENWD